MSPLAPRRPFASAALRAAALVLCLAWPLVGLPACKSTPKIRHYQVIAEPIEQGPRQPAEVVLAVDYLSANAAYDDPRIVYRENPYRLDYYHYHRWTASPSVMITDAMRELFQRSGHFKAVTSGYTSGVDVLLRGRVVSLEEVDVSEGEWVARLVLDLQLQDVDSGLVIWSRTLRRDQPVEQRDPEGVARALSAALRELVAEISPQLIEARERAARSRQRPEAFDPDPEAPQPSLQDSP